MFAFVRSAYISSILAPLIFAGCATHPNATLSEYSQAHSPKELAEDLRASVEKLAGDIGERNVYRPKNLTTAAEWIEDQFRQRGYDQVAELPVRVTGKTFGVANDVVAYNIEAILPSTESPAAAGAVNSAKPETIVIGAHYDSRVAMPGWHDHWPPIPQRLGTPGANDNGSGVAALLYLAGTLRLKPHRQTLRFVAFVNEEPPFFQTDAMGSLVYARMLRAQGLKNVRMISLETLGCYSPRIHSKRVFGVSMAGLPDSSNYVAFVGNAGSIAWINQVAKPFSLVSRIEVRTLALPEVTKQVAWSDDWSFWKSGYPAFSVTDTAFLRHDDYHELNDTSDFIDYEPMSEVVWALGETIEKLLDEAPHNAEDRK